MAMQTVRKENGDFASRDLRTNEKTAKRDYTKCIRDYTNAEQIFRIFFATNHI